MVYETLGRLETLGMTTMIEHVVWILFALAVFLIVNMVTGITGLILGILGKPLTWLLHLKAPPERSKECIKKRTKEVKSKEPEEENSEVKGQENSVLQDEQDEGEE